MARGLAASNRRGRRLPKTPKEHDRDSTRTSQSPVHAKENCLGDPQMFGSHAWGEFRWNPTESHQALVQRSCVRFSDSEPRAGGRLPPMDRATLVNGPLCLCLYYSRFVFKDGRSSRQLGPLMNRSLPGLSVIHHPGNWSVGEQPDRLTASMNV